ncbi:MAG TPA: hypothetical protein VH764_02405 [Gemmatimonadales bacterium]|jgi:hypothetical protein
MTTTNAPTRADPEAIARMSRSQLDQLFRDSPAGPVPAGRARGTAMLLPGSALDRAIAAVVRAVVWKGKVFSSATSDLKNRIGPLGTPLIRALVYQDKSWFADGPAIILDYSKTSLVARKIRDEIRQVGPGVYLGQVFWGKRRIALFMLEF